jgi:membrane protein required for beta-lactamase induction
MGLIVIVASLFLERALGHLQHLRRLDWFPGYRLRLTRLLPESWTTGVGGVIAIFVPVIAATFLLQWLLHDRLWGLLELLFSIAIVTYCLGPETFNHQVDAYLEAVDAGEHEKAKSIAQRLVGGPVSDDIHRQAKQVTTSILYEGNIRIFAVLFWFMILGPAGALLFRVAGALVHDSRARSALADTDAIDAEQLVLVERIYGVLDWVPAHLLSLTFFLAGSFDDAWHGWRKARQTRQPFTESSRSVVIATGCGAMQHEVDDTVADEASVEEYDLQWIRTARALVLRSLVVWLVVVALLTMAGWFV